MYKTDAQWRSCQFWCCGVSFGAVAGLFFFYIKPDSFNRFLTVWSLMLTPVAVLKWIEPMCSGVAIPHGMLCGDRSLRGVVNLPQPCPGRLGYKPVVWERVHNLETIKGTHQIHLLHIFMHPQIPAFEQVWQLGLQSEIFIYRLLASLEAIIPKPAKINVITWAASWSNLKSK